MQKKSLIEIVDPEYLITYHNIASITAHKFRNIFEQMSTYPEHLEILIDVLSYDEMTRNYNDFIDAYGDINARLNAMYRTLKLHTDDISMSAFGTTGGLHSETQHGQRFLRAFVVGAAAITPLIDDGRMLFDCEKIAQNIRRISNMDRIIDINAALFHSRESVCRVCALVGSYLRDTDTSHQRHLILIDETDPDTIH